jgi:hypothetical protein
MNDSKLISSEKPCRKTNSIVLDIVVWIMIFVGGVLVGTLIGYRVSLSVSTTYENNDSAEKAESLSSYFTVTPVSESELLTSTVPSTSTVQPKTEGLLSDNIDITPTSTSTPRPTATPRPFFHGPIEYGRSFNNNPLYAYRLGNGSSVRMIVGGIHGGYEWNTVELVSETLKYLSENPASVPPTVTLYLIPCANPDGYKAGTDAVVGRMNGNGVDLNRNWDYQWQMTATHGTRPVKAGGYAFSEPETQSLKKLIEDKDVEAAIFYHSAMGVIFSGAEPEKSATLELAKMLSRETGYRLQTEGVPGQITTGDAIDWLSAKKGIAGAEIELTTHNSILGTPEFGDNIQGVLAFLSWQIPSQNAMTLEMGDWEIYTVQADDGGLWAIANKFGIEIGSPRYETLLAVNYIDNPDEIIVGQVLTIPLSIEEE